MRNPFQISLLVVAGFAFVVAFMLWGVIAQVTDYAGYDPFEATVLWGWTIALAIVGATAILGVVAIAGVGWELRRSREREPHDVVTTR
ncbi:hypothetical protein [Microbacterium jejuense]|uniref:hypothetical protein n=1 Tax=Microbacterium jejuense TaxID=1263637 RepID=UPI0031E85D8B